MDLKQYIMAKRYTDRSIEGTSGVLAGKNCQIASIEQIKEEGRTGRLITFSWYKDGETEARTDSIIVWDGEKGDKGDTGDKGEPGDTPEITVAEQTADTYKLEIKVGETDIITPNLKGSGGKGVDVSVDGQTLIFIY